MKGTNVKGIEEYYHDWNNDIAFLNEMLAGQFGGGENSFRIDEVALMFNSKADMWQWLEQQLPKPGVELFNVAQDHVRTYPFLTEYDVNYFFLNVPGDYRVECMSIGGAGLSPLHEALRHRYLRDEPKPTVHYSFKCRDHDEYTRVTQWLAAAEFINVQNCVSAYGEFGYWLLSENVDPEVKFSTYLKPRVNTRDEPVIYPTAGIEGYLSSKAGK